MGNYRKMESRRRETDWTAAFKFDNIEPNVRLHLKKVYSCLAIGMLSAAVGGYLHIFSGLIQGGLLSALCSIGLMIWLACTKHERKNTPMRLGIFSGFALCSGLSAGPLMEHVTHINPTIVPTAFLATCVIFICFSISALLNGNDRKYLYLGGMLFSGLSILLFSSILNLFFRSQLLYQAHLYLGLLIMCGFILFDTQLIIEKFRHHDDDFIWHSVDLFIDFMQVFRKLMIILAEKDKKRKD